MVLTGAAVVVVTGRYRGGAVTDGGRCVGGWSKSSETSKTCCTTPLKKIIGKINVHVAFLGGRGGLDFVVDFCLNNYCLKKH